MLGVLISDKERRELDYILRKEMNELLDDIADDRLDQDIRDSMLNRYKGIVRMFSKVHMNQRDLVHYQNKGVTLRRGVK